jgi:membrane metallo-endopeptidase-like protein 1
VEWTNKKLGMAVGSLYIRDHFKHDSKETALEMIHDIRHAFNELLHENMWMDKETRLVAEDKANNMRERIGYPEYITNTTRLIEEYKNVNISTETFLSNLFAILEYEATRNIGKLRKPVEKEIWGIPPAQVNAFYNPNKNDIVFPAGILQPFFYAAHFPKSLNYGGIGVVFDCLPLSSNPCVISWPITTPIPP